MLYTEENKHTPIKDALIRVLKNYLDEKENDFSNNQLANFIRKQTSLIFRRPFDYPVKYKIEGSAGKGKWANVPWICIFDKDITETAQKGYYIVYLFKADMSGVYISLNQGYTYFEKKYGAAKGREKLKKTAQLIRNRLNINDNLSLNSIELSSTGNLAKGYEQGHICGKYYDRSDFDRIDERTFLKDLSELKSIYLALKAIMGGRKTDEFNDYILLEEDYNFLEGKEELYQEEVNKLANTLSQEVREEGQDYGVRPPKKTIIDEGGNEHYPRSAKEAAAALIREGYLCEMDPNHETFISKATKENYMEAHHFIGISHYKKFPEIDLDRSANIICLCPGCHRKIHHALDPVKEEMIEQLYDRVKERLEKVGVKVTLADVKSLYNIG